MTNARQEYVPRQQILVEIKQALAAHGPGEIEWITFVGSGEPTLHVGLGWLIAQVKAITDLPVAVITNGSLLYLPEVRQDLLPADAVLPSLDAGSPELYRRLNRPHPEVTFTRLIEGLLAFRQVYTGKLWAEVMLVQGMNDTAEALREMAIVLRRIDPDEVHLNLPIRPPAEVWVRPSDAEGLLRAQAILGDVARVIHPAQGTYDLGGCHDVVEAIINIITRHPMRQDELEQALSYWTPGQVEAALTALQISGRAQMIERLGVCFWSAAASYYPESDSC